MRHAAREESRKEMEKKVGKVVGEVGKSKMGNSGKNDVSGAGAVGSRGVQ